MNYKIVTDSSSNLFCREDVAYATVPMKIIAGDKEYVDDPQLDVAGMLYDDAMQRLLLSEGLEPFLADGSQITITVAGGTDAHAEKMLSRVLCRAYNIANKENVLYCQVDWETVKAAREVNLCIPRYLAWQNLLKNNPNMTAEDVREIPKEKIRVLAQIIIIEDPCHE